MYIHVSAYTMYVCTYIYYHYKHYANQTCSKPLLDFALMCLRSALCVCVCLCACVCVFVVNRIIVLKVRSEEIDMYIRFKLHNESDTTLNVFGFILRYMTQNIVQ